VVIRRYAWMVQQATPPSCSRTTKTSWLRDRGDASVLGAWLRGPYLRSYHRPHCNHRPLRNLRGSDMERER
jgi:hypothetical protein